MASRGTGSDGTVARGAGADDGAGRRDPLLCAVPSRIGDQVVLTLVGEIDLSTADAVRAAVADCLQGSPAGLAVNVGAVAFCDRGGIRALHEALRAARARGAEFRLLAVGPWLQQLMTLAGETDLLAVAESDAGSPHRRRPAARAAAAQARPDVNALPGTLPDAPTEGGDAFALVRVIGKSVHALHRQSTPEEMLRHAADLAAAHVPGVAAAAVSVLDAEQDHDTLATGALAAAAEKAQRAAGHGPAWEACKRKTLIHVPDLAAERRWAAFVDEARGLGITSVIACDLGRYRGGRAVLSMYGTAPAGFRPAAVARADLLAAYAVLALNQSASTEALHAAVRSRQVIGEATGILMERHRVDATTAFGMIVTASQHANVKVRLLAEQVVLTGLDPDRCVTG